LLTDQKILGAIKRAKAEAKVIALRDAGKTPGLELRISYNGTASFALVYQANGDPVRKRFKLGQYGTAYGLADARRDAEGIRGRQHDGIDPVEQRGKIKAEQRREAEERKARAEADAKRITVRQLSRLFLGAKAGMPWEARYSQILNMNVLPVIGDRPARRHHPRRHAACRRYGGRAWGHGPSAANLRGRPCHAQMGRHARLHHRRALARRGVAR
jgi:hypothetical protein